MPLHTLLTDVVKAGGDSSELVKSLNRFRAVASEDTHSRLVTSISSIREKEIQLEMTPDVFRLASIDNVDVVPLHASAYAGKPSNIWHGTSVQCIEPKPKSLSDTTKLNQVDSTLLLQSAPQVTQPLSQLDTGLPQQSAP